MKKMRFAKTVLFAAVLVFLGRGELAAARYLSPEPMLQDPNWVARQASRGNPAPTYAYALNNPVRFTDPNGREVQNLSSSSVVVKLEDGNSYIVLPPGETFHGPQDAVYSSDGSVYKTFGNGADLGASVIVNANGSVTVFPNPGEALPTAAANLAGPFSVGDPFIKKHDWLPRSDAQSLIDHANRNSTCGGL